MRSVLQQRNVLRIGRLRESNDVGVDVRRLLIAQHLFREGRHHLPRRTKLRDESRIDRRVDEFWARSPALACPAVAFETSPPAEHLPPPGDTTPPRARPAKRPPPRK